MNTSIADAAILFIHIQYMSLLFKSKALMKMFNDYSRMSDAWLHTICTDLINS